MTHGTGQTWAQVAALPDGSVYVLADATADLSSQPIKGQSDVALFKYDSTGHLVYSRVLGAAEQSQGFALAVDSATGKVAVAGSVTGALGDGDELAFGNVKFLFLYSSEA